MNILEWQISGNLLLLYLKRVYLSAINHFLLLRPKWQELQHPCSLQKINSYPPHPDMLPCYAKTGLKDFFVSSRSEMAYRFRIYRIFSGFKPEYVGRNVSPLVSPWNALGTDSVIGHITISAAIPWSSCNCTIEALVWYTPCCQPNLLLVWQWPRSEDQFILDMAHFYVASLKVPSADPRQALTRHNHF